MCTEAGLEAPPGSQETSDTLSSEQTAAVAGGAAAAVVVLVVVAVLVMRSVGRGGTRRSSSRSKVVPDFLVSNYPNFYTTDALRASSGSSKGRATDIKA